MPPGQVRHGQSASQSQPRSGPGSILTAPVPSAVSRKKAKRRAKDAAKRAAEQAVSNVGPASPTASISARNGSDEYSVPGAFDQNSLDPHVYPQEELGPDDAVDDYDAANGEYHYSDAEASYPTQIPAPTSKSKKKKKKKKNKTGSVSQSQDDYYDSQQLYSNHNPPPPPPPPLSHPHPHTHSFNQERIWSQSGSEEREQIKEFWLSLEEEERRSLVKVEKEAVLKKMKEQQKHSCSCSVCGRKRTAIEEELEVLYDAYYEELEQYANNKVILEDGTVINGPEAARAYPPVLNRSPPFVGPNGARSRFQEEAGDDEEDLEGEEFYSDEEYEDDYDDVPPPHASDFFNFGNSLTVQGGILTVADDLLKNDGKKFIEMMEQLAERRMRREEDAQYAAVDGMRHPSQQYDDDDGYDDEEYATDDEEDYPEDDEHEENADPMTEEQRMEEGRRMFQIFAARMFEQRVLTAYREKVARERQERLLEELEDEKDRDAEKEAAKARKSAKAKEKKSRLKQQKKEEEAKRDAEKKAAADAAKAEEDKKAEEIRKKREEQKKKRDEEKRRIEEEKLKKEEDKKRKLADARKQQEEQDRRLREQKEKERLKREEIKRKEMEEKASREKELKDRKERETAAKKEKEAKTKAERQATQQARKTDQQMKVVVAPGAAMPAPPLLRKQASSAGVTSASALHTSAQASPHLQIATPVIPKAPSPGRPRQASQQGSSSVQGSLQSSPKSGQPRSSSSTTSPSTTQQLPTPSTQHLPPKGVLPGPQVQIPPGHVHSHSIAPPPGMPYPPGPAPGMHMNGFPSSFGPHHAPSSRFPSHNPDPMFGGNGFGVPYRGFGSPNGIPFPPGMNGMRPMGSGPPGISPISASSPHAVGSSSFGMHSHAFPPAPGQRTQPHSRQASATLEKSASEMTSIATAQPIGPPAPIKRPSSSGEKTGGEKVDELSKQLGSSALIDDDAPVELSSRDMQGGPVPFNSAPLFQEPFRGPPARGGFGNHMGPFHLGYSGSISAGGWAAPPNQHFGGPPFGVPRHSSRPAWVRVLVVEACNRLSKSPHTQNSQQGGFHNIEAITNEVNAMRSQTEVPVLQQEIVEICDTEGNSMNGGGSFLRNHVPGVGVLIRHEREDPTLSQARHSVGDIGSPVISHVTPSFAPAASAAAPGFGAGRSFGIAPGGSSF